MLLNPDAAYKIGQVISCVHMLYLVYTCYILFPDAISPLRAVYYFQMLYLLYTLYLVSRCYISFIRYNLFTHVISCLHVTSCFQVITVIASVSGIIVYRVIVSVDFCPKMNGKECFLLTSVTSSVLNALSITILVHVCKILQSSFHWPVWF